MIRSMIATKTSILLAVTLALQTGNAAFAQGIYEQLIENPAPVGTVETETETEREPSRFTYLPAGSLAVLQRFKNGKQGKAIEIATATRIGSSINLWTARGPDGSAAGIKIDYDSTEKAADILSWLSRQQAAVGIYAAGCFRHGEVEKGSPSGQSYKVWKIGCSSSSDINSSDGAYIHSVNFWAPAYQIVSAHQAGAIGDLYASSIAPRFVPEITLKGQSPNGSGK